VNLAAHVGFFLLLSFAIVVMSAFYTEVEDAPALRSVPRRYAVFVGACTVVAVIMLVFERLFATAS
jgi:hypothetical protein